MKDTQRQRSQRWVYVWLMGMYVELSGKRMQRSTIINLICDNVEDLVVLLAHGYRSVVFRDSTIATLKMIKYDDADDNRETALDVVATHIKKECSMMDYTHHTYHTNTSKEIAEESAPDNLEQLLRKISIGQQFLPSLLIGNIITSAIKKRPTPFQIALGVYFNKNKTVKHMHYYLVCCSHDELLRFKKSSVVSKNFQISNDRRQPVQWKDMFK